MSIKPLAAKVFAKIVKKKIDSWVNNPLETQEKVFQELISKAASTQFGKDHDFISINNHKDFVKRVPVKDYEALKPYVEKVVAGESDILWPGKPLYFAKTSGTTSGVKYIPLTKDSMPNHMRTATSALIAFPATR